MQTTKPAKPFAWSFSKLKNYETCPFRHEQVDLKKNFRDESDELAWGNSVHDAMKVACRDGVPLPKEMAAYQKWVDRTRNAVTLGAVLLVEQQYAITQRFEPCKWFDRTAWFRAIGDTVLLFGDTVAAVQDWKTGKVKVDSVQLMLTAQCLFSHFPTLQKVRSEFVWLKEDCATPEDYTRQDLAREWPALLDRVRLMENSYNTQSYPPRPSRLCKRFCPVTSCQYHGQAHGG